MDDEVVRVQLVCGWGFPSVILINVLVAVQLWMFLVHMASVVVIARVAITDMQLSRTLLNDL